jgi:hypothetical protein
MAKEAPDSVVVLESFVGRVGSDEKLYRKGDLVRVGDPAVKKWPNLFGPVNYAHEERVEQATAAPGEKR